MEQKTKDKISKSLKKYTKTDKHRKNLSESNKGKKSSKETKKKLSNIHKELNKEGKNIPPSRRGMKPWNYEGKTILQEQIRKCFEYRQWRSDVFTRDNFTCQRCGKHGEKLNVDHIKEFAIILKENNIKSLKEALNCEELWNINNGRTLCIECHRTRKKWDKEVEIVDDLIYKRK